MRILILIAYFLMSSTAYSMDGSSEDRWMQRENIESFIDKGPVFLENKNDITEYKKVGVLIDEKVKFFQNRHVASKKDELHVLVFDGLVIEGINSMYSNGVFSPTRILISSSGWSIYKSLNVGESKSKIVDILGNPNASNNETLRCQGKENLGYCGESDCVYFSVSNGKIDQIEFVYYAD